MIIMLITKPTKKLTAAALVKPNLVTNNPAIINETVVEKTVGNVISNCDLTKSIWYDPQLKEDISIVSEIGDKWLATTDPETIAPIIGIRRGKSETCIGTDNWDNDAIIGIDIGIIIPIVPQADPINVAITTDKTKRIGGTKLISRCWVKKEAI